MIPSPEPFAPRALHLDALERLEWPRLTAALAAEACYPSTKERLISLEPFVDETARDHALDATEELAPLLGAGVDLGLLPVRLEDLLPSILRAAPLAAGQLFELSLLLRSAASAANLRDKMKREGSLARLPRLEALLARVLPLEALRRRLQDAVDSDGNVLDTASPGLHSARGKAGNARRKVVAELESLMKRSHIQQALQESVWMLRDGRYVLPVRTDRRSDVHGIPRGVSASGSTIFVEPAELAAAQADLARAEADVMVEEARVLQELSQLAAQNGDAIDANADALVELDSIQARARLAARLQAIRPRFLPQRPESPRFAFAGARHPLFLVENKDCVANDLMLAAESQGAQAPLVWVLTGPNAGGKTVAMRTVGLLVLMASAGLMVPASSAALVPFKEVCVELGDRQDRSEDLSTFSGHLLHLKGILDRADASCLVLLDEGFVGTDPAVGVCLARSTLEELAGRGTTAIITTHFSALKTLANEDPRFRNASMEFEARTLSPRYTLLNGVPGQSFALELATRLGFPESILAASRRYLGSEAQRMESLLAELQERKRDLEEAQHAQRKTEAELAEELAAIQRERGQLHGLRDALVDDYQRRLKRRLSAFEHRLEIRERQFERHQQEAMRSHEERLARRLEAAAPDAEEGSDLRGMESTASTLPQDARSALTAGTQTQPARETSPDSSAARGKRVSLEGGLGALSQVKLNTAPQGHKAPGGNERWDPLADAKFRKPKQFSARSLLDEARESLEGLEDAGANLGAAFGAELAELAGMQDQSAAKQGAAKLEAAREQRGKALELKPGMRVKCARFSGTGQVLRTPDGKGLVECSFGAVTMKMAAAELQPLDASGATILPSGGKQGKAQQTPQPANTPPGARAQLPPERPSSVDKGNIPHTFSHGGNTCDLRGMSVDEAITRLERFLDAAERDSQERVVIVHGHGTGRVKQAVRERLEELAFAYRPGSSGEGGDGATVVQLGD